MPAINDATAVPCGSMISPPRLIAVPPTTSTPPPSRDTPESSTATLTPAPGAGRAAQQRVRLGDAQPVEGRARVGGGDDLVADVVAQHALERTGRGGVRRHGRQGGQRHRREHGGAPEQACYSHGFPLARTGGHRASDTDRLTPRSKSSTHESGTTGASKSANPRLSATSGPTSG